MADEEEADSKDASGGGKPWLLIGIVALVFAGAGAGGAFFMLGSGASEAEAAVSEVAEPEPDPAADFRERIYALEPFVVNVTSEGYPRYLKLKLELEADGASTVEEIDARLAQIRDLVILLLSSKRLADISDFEGKALLKDDLRERINEILEKGQVASVLFTEFVVQ